MKKKDSSSAASIEIPKATLEALDELVLARATDSERAELTRLPRAKRLANLAEHVRDKLDAGQSERVRIDAERAKLTLDYLSLIEERREPLMQTARAALDEKNVAVAKDALDEIRRIDATWAEAGAKVRRIVEKERARFDNAVRAALVPHLAEFYRTKDEDLVTDVASVLGVARDALRTALTLHEGDASADGPRDGARRAIGKACGKHERTIARGQGSVDLFASIAEGRLAAARDKRTPRTGIASLGGRGLGGELSIAALVLGGLSRD